ncbi:hypothetical protein VB774_14330 [Pseudanabaena galeata UHCC 0370]|uniref:Uncharacterized protein n=1 Tax=Pseudanabaena galeata UHCC 0370 TaxID=3110310 RepID=A0ABU5TKJ9_9CYAN|nr:hypothetical protein [Pseudanabaena galeata]MEA5478801.1 hypothetical protein [Pseudanabaena galeata UHCC 0370]
MKFTCQDFQENYRDCTNCSEGKLVVAEENKRKYILQNPSKKKICKVRIDGCVIPSQSQRKCDYLMIVCESKSTNEQESDIYFIELKGRDLISAVEQLTQTIAYFQAEKYQFIGKVFARVVLSKVADPKSIEVDSRVIALRKLMKKLGGNFDYGSVQFEKDCI